MADSGEHLQSIIEAALLVAGRPLTPYQLQKIFSADALPEISSICAALEAIATRFQHGGIALCEVASGWQLQSRPEFGSYIAKLWTERPPRYSRAILETLALIAWRQPITRAEIEDIRGVSVSSTIMKTLQDREWIRVVGQRDVPGKPSIYATTRQFLDHFNLKNLEGLPPLSEVMAIEALGLQVPPEFSPELSEDKFPENPPITVSVLSEVPLPINVTPVELLIADDQEQEPERLMTAEA